MSSKNNSNPSKMVSMCIKNAWNSQKNKTTANSHSKAGPLCSISTSHWSCSEKADLDRSTNVTISRITNRSQSKLIISTKILNIRRNSLNMFNDRRMLWRNLIILTSASLLNCWNAAETRSHLPWSIVQGLNSPITWKNISVWKRRRPNRSSAKYSQH